MFCVHSSRTAKLRGVSTDVWQSDTALGESPDNATLPAWLHLASAAHCNLRGLLCTEVRIGHLLSLLRRCIWPPIAHAQLLFCCPFRVLLHLFSAFSSVLLQLMLLPALISSLSKKVINFAYNAAVQCSRCDASLQAYSLPVANELAVCK